MNTARVAEVADEGDVVLDDADRAPGRRLVAHHLLDRLVACPSTPAIGSSSSRHLAVVHQRAREADQLLLAEGQLGRESCRARGESDARQDRFGALARIASLRASRPVEQAGEQGLAG